MPISNHEVITDSLMASQTAVAAIDQPEKIERFGNDTYKHAIRLRGQEEAQKAKNSQAVSPEENISPTV